MKIKTLNLCRDIEIFIFALLFQIMVIISTHFMLPVSFYSPVETSENLKFSDVSRGYRKRSVV